MNGLKPVMHKLRRTATLCDISVDTLRYQEALGLINFKSIGGRFFILDEELRRWARSPPSSRD